MKRFTWRKKPAETRFVLDNNMEQDKSPIKKNPEDTVVDGKSPLKLASPQDIIGKTLGDFKIIKELGRGGMAIVYEARQISLDRNVAIKIIPQALVEEPEYLERFKREASSAANLNHPNIVSIHGFGKLENTYYYVMDLAKGKTLDVIIEEKKHGLFKKVKQFAAVDALKIIEQAAGALSYAHKQGIIHRDIKSSNFIIDEETGRVLITDFGLSKSTRWEKITSNASLFGTPAYMSPEQASGKEVDERTDIYSLGTVMFEMLTGTLPYSGDNALEVIDKVKTEPIPLPKKINKYIPEAVESVILKAMSRDLHLRYQSMDEFLLDIQKFSEGEKISDFVKIARHRVETVKRMKRIFLVSPLVIIVVLGVSFGLYKFTSYINKKHTSKRMSEQFQLAENYERMGLKGSAQEIYKEIIEKHPGTEYAVKAKTQLSK